MTTQPPFTITQKLFSLFPALWAFAARWLQTRDYRLLWRAVPAIAIATVVAIGILSRPFYGKEAMGKHYRLAAEQAIGDQRYEEAALYCNRLKQMDAMDDATQFRVALVRKEAGDLAGAWSIIDEIAPLDRTGHIPAHLWSAQQLATGQVMLSDAEAVTLAKAHLTRVLEQDDSNLDALNLIVALLIKTREYEEAERHLRTLVELRPTARLQLIQLFDVMKDSDRMRDEAGTLIAHFKLQAPDSFSADVYPIWAQAHAVLDEFEEAETVMQTGRRRFPANATLTAAMSRVYTTWASKLGSYDEDLTRQIEYLSRATALNPSDPMPWAQLAQLTRHEGKTVAQAKALLQPVLATGKAPAEVHLVLGTIAAEANDQKRAKMHFEAAIKQNPQGPVALNNLAWVFLQSGDSLERAEELATMALELSPKNKQFLDTRGRVRMKLQRWQDAIADFESVLEQDQDDNLQVLNLMAEAYTKMGFPDIGKSFRERASRP
jgi:tetratricopeptide (TPR) repeat protein